MTVLLTDLDYSYDYDFKSLYTVAVIMPLVLPECPVYNDDSPPLLYTGV